MAKGYCIFHITVRDPERYKAYIAADAPAFAKYGGRFVARGGRFEAVEGSAHTRHVVIEFDSYAAARAYYHSPEYSAAAQIRRSAADADVVIIEGVGE